MKISNTHILSNRISQIILHLSLFSIFFFLNINSIYSKDTVDVIRPLVIKNNYCADFTINVSDNRSYDINNDTFQLDLGIIDPPNIYTSLSYNFSEMYASTFKQGKINYEFSFRMSVLDPFQDAKAVFVVYDATKNNKTFDSLIYKAEKLQIIPSSISFGNTYIGMSSELNSNILNIHNNSAIFIKSIKLKYGDVFSLKNTPQNIFLDTNENLKIFINYTPKTDQYINNSFDSDSLIIETNCLRYVIPISGRGVKAGIIVEDFDFGAVEINSTNCTGTESYKGLRIFNSGTGRLLVNGYYPLTVNSPFYLKKPTTPDVNNLIINPNSENLIEGICFKPNQVGEFIEPLVFKSNADGTDSIAYLRGIAYLPGPHLSMIDFGRVRLGNSVKKNIIVKNSGSYPVSINDFILENDNSDFKIIYDDCIPPIDRHNPIVLYPDKENFAGNLQSIVLVIEFSPKKEFYQEIRVIPVFDNNSEYKTGTVFNYARAYGFLPKIKANGYTFLGKTQVNNKHNETGYISISSISNSANLYLKSIKIKPIYPTTNIDFILKSKLVNDTIIQTNSEPLKMPFIFIPREAGERIAKVEIISDAYSAGSTWDTTIVYLKGIGYNKVLFVESLTLDSLSQCDEHNAKIKIKNLSNEKEAYIFDIIKIYGDTNAFKINTDTIDNNFVIIPPNDSLYIDVTFNATSFLQNNFDLAFKVFSDVDTSIGTIKATTKRYNTSISLPILRSISPGIILQYAPPKYYGPDFNIEADFSKVKNIGLNSFILEIKFNKKELMYLNNINKGELLKNWDNISSYVYNLDNKYSILQIKASGTEFLDGKIGTLIKPVFVLLLNDSSVININLHSISFTNYDNCVNIKKNDGQIHLSYCGEQIRNIVISQNFFNLSSISANPNYESNMILSYRVPYEVFTNIEIYNSFGEKIASIVSEQIREGEYFYNFDTRLISSGVYYVKMISGPFTKTLPINIIK